MRVYTFQLPKFLSAITRGCINLFTVNKRKKHKEL